MSSDEENELDYPTAGSEITWLGFFIRAEFHPGIRIATKAGHEFATTIHSAMEAGVSNVDGKEWIFKGSRAYDGMQVSVDKDSVELTVKHPQNAQDWYEDRFASILEVFARKYEPKVLLACHAMATGLLPVTGDARSFLGGNLMFMHPKKLDVFTRPMHVLGVRILLPAYEDKDKDSEANWGVDVKVESWYEDPSKLYLEADADWFESERWGDETPATIVGHLKTVTDFMNTRLLAFLHQHPFMGMDDDEGDGDDNEPESGQDDE